MGLMNRELDPVLEKTGAEVGAVLAPKVAAGSVEKVVGKMDAFSSRGRAALVVDYKTGVHADAEPTPAPSYRLQAECYALAAMCSGAEKVEVVFTDVETGDESVFGFGRSDRAGIESRIGDMLTRMAQECLEDRGEFEASACATCPSLAGMCAVRRTGARSAAGAGRRRPGGPLPARP